MFCQWSVAQAALTSPGNLLGRLCEQSSSGHALQGQPYAACAADSSRCSGTWFVLARRNTSSRLPLAQNSATMQGGSRQSPKNLHAAGSQQGVSTRALCCTVPVIDKAVRCLSPHQISRVMHRGQIGSCRLHAALLPNLTSLGCCREAILCSIKQPWSACKAMLQPLITGIHRGCSALPHEPVSALLGNPSAWAPSAGWPCACLNLPCPGPHSGTKTVAAPWLPASAKASS